MFALTTAFAGTFVLSPIGRFGIPHGRTSGIRCQLEPGQTFNVGPDEGGSGEGETLGFNVGLGAASSPDSGRMQMFDEVFQKGGLAIQEGDMGRALGYFKQALAIDPNNVQVSRRE